MRKLRTTAKQAGNRTALLAQPKTKHGFTLVELLIVIAVIAILIALLLPAIAGARRNAQTTQVVVEVNALASALTSFKNAYGGYPPSRFLLFEDASAYNTTMADPDLDALRIRSKATIRQFWPEFSFTRFATGPATAPHDYNFNFDGDRDDFFILFGAQCLTFFLGGPTGWIDTNGDSLVDDADDFRLAGFGKNPAFPFAHSGSRQQPSFTFLKSRLVPAPDSSNSTRFTFGYADPLPSQTMPYLYLSSYDGKGYQNIDRGTTPIGLVYIESSNPTATAPAINPTTFQIISPGSDKAYGPGGSYVAEKASDLLVGARDAEQDNITNFKGGTLGGR